MKLKFLFLVIAIMFQSCLYTNVKTPGWYYSQSYTDVKGMEVVGKLSGESCGESWVWSVYTGDESFDAAVTNALSKGKADLLFNVQTDYYTKLYAFGLYYYKCTKVTGIGVKIGANPVKTIEEKK